MEKYKITFYLINNEGSHLIETKSLICAKNYMKYQFKDNSKVLDLTDG